MISVLLFFFISSEGKKRKKQKDDFGKEGLVRNTTLGTRQRRRCAPYAIVSNNERLDVDKRQKMWKEKKRENRERRATMFEVVCLFCFFVKEERRWRYTTEEEVDRREERVEKAHPQKEKNYTLRTYLAGPKGRT